MEFFNYNYETAKKLQKVITCGKISLIMLCLDIVALIILAILNAKEPSETFKKLIEFCSYFLAVPFIVLYFCNKAIKYYKNKMLSCPKCGDQTEIICSTDIFEVDGQKVHPLLCEKCGHTWSKNVNDKD